MSYCIRLIGRSKGFTVGFLGRLKDCGFEAEALEPVQGGAAGAALPEGHGDDVLIFEVQKKGDVSKIPYLRAGHGRPSEPGRPFLVYTGLDPVELEVVKDSGLIGAVSEETPDEEVAFLVNKALFYNKVVMRNPRVHTSIPLVLYCESGTIKTNSTQISREGMFVGSLAPPPVNSVCVLEFEIPGSKCIRTKARVIYHIELNRDLNIISMPSDPFKRLVMYPGMAVFFLDIPEEDKAVIVTYIEGLE